jgi:outer membrane protein assembly factor BamB
VLVEKGTVYITVNSGNEGCYVWLFDPETGSSKKGLKLSDDTEYIFAVRAAD